MLKFLGLTILIVALSESCRVIEQRANGVTVERDTYSGLVFIEAFSSYTAKYMCTGVLISSNFVLTSANCVFGTTFVNVHVYAHKLRDQFEESREIHRVPSSEIYFNEFNGLDRINDIALIKMPDSFSTVGKNYLKLLDLPTRALNVGDTGETIGWGLLDFKDDHAAALKQKLSLTVLSEDNCREAYPSLRWSEGAEGRDCVKASSGVNCVSDIGSPFMIGNVVFGVQSHGQIDACDSSEKPNLITDVFYHLDWIRNITASST